MYGRVTIAHPDVDRLDDAVTMVERVFAAGAREQPGYRGFLLLVDRDTPQLTGISLWASEADRKASAGSGGYYQDGVAAFVKLLTQSPTTTDVEVAISDVPNG